MVLRRGDPGEPGALCGFDLGSDGEVLARALAQQPRLLVLATAERHPDGIIRVAYGAEPLA